MSHLSLVAGIVCLLAWLYLLLEHGRFWMLQRLLPSSETISTQEKRPFKIAAVIPARNEADVIGRAIASLLNQQGWSPAAEEGVTALHIFVVDDHSTDGTAATAQAASANSGQVTVVSSAPLPDGWTGKLWAMQQGIERALQIKPDFLLLTDADIEHAPGNLAKLVSISEDANYDLASFMVKLNCRSLAEKLLIPAFVFFFFMLYPPEWVRDPRRRTSGAAGGCLLIRPSALNRIGGIAAIKGEIIDDCALALAVKRSGGKVWLGAAADTHSLRPYKSFGEIERMIARTAFNQLKHSGWLLTATVLGMLLLYVAPLALLAGGSPRLVLLGASSYALMVAAYLPMVRFYGLNLLWALTLPLAGVFYTAATVHSAIAYWSGKGGEWKGRAQDQMAGD
jgi:hopene-associated glycosyltransferase HpnB